VSDAKGHNDPILCLDYHHDQDCVVSCGVNHIKFWNLQKDIVGGAEVDKLKCRKGVMSSKKAGANLGGKIQVSAAVCACSSISGAALTHILCFLLPHHHHDHVFSLLFSPSVLSSPTTTDHVLHCFPARPARSLWG
jgi:hypothetical protein